MQNRINYIYGKRLEVNYIFLFLLFLVSSFDIFMKLEIEGFSFRFVYLIELFLVVYVLKESLLTNKLKIRLLNGRYLIMWLLFIVLFIPNTTLIKRNVGYAVWLILSIILVTVLTSIINDQNKMKRVFHLYIVSFQLIAIFGLIQFLFGVMGFSLLTQEWWINGVLPRINGFSYEPSYYGSYLMIGWTILFYLYMNYKVLFYKYKITFLIITISIILSSSRMAIFLMMFVFLGSLLMSLARKVFRLKILKRDFKLFIFINIILIIVFLLFVIDFAKVKFLIAGLGILGASGHSSSARIDRMIDTFQVFLHSPFIGYSLGGVAPAIANLKGIVITTQTEAKSFEGMNIFVEVLAASSVVGYIFFLLFFTILFYKAKSMARNLKYISVYNSMIIRALAFALFWELFILSMNQNILRPYLWILIGMLSASIFIGRRIINEVKISDKFQPIDQFL